MPLGQPFYDGLVGLATLAYVQYCTLTCRGEKLEEPKSLAFDITTTNAAPDQVHPHIYDY